MENLIVQWGRDQASLVPSQEVWPFEFHYQWENSYSSYYVGAYQARREGYISIGSRPTHLGIIKTDALEHGGGIDYGFIKNLIGNLQAAGLKAVPYKEVGTSFDATFKSVGYEPEDPVETGFQTGETVPDMEIGQSNAHQLSPAISVSRASGSWAYFIETSSADWLIPKILAYMEAAAKPLIDNDLIDYYEIVDRRSNKKTNIVFSKKGKREDEDWKTKNDKSASHIKYLVSVTLPETSLFGKEVIGRVNAEGMKNAEGWFGRKAQPKNFHVSLEDLYSMNANSFADDIVIKTFLDAVKLKDEGRFEQLDQATAWAENKKRLDPSRYWLGGLLEVLGWFWENDIIIRDLTEPEHVLYYLGNLYSVIISYGDIVSVLEPEEYSYLKQRAKSAIETALQGEGDENYPSLTTSDIHKLNELAGPLKLHPSIVSALEQQSKSLKDQESERLRQREASAKKATFLMPVDHQAYMEINEGKWKAVPSKFLDYNYGAYEIDLGELALDMVGEEDVWEDAYAKAEEDAMADVEERPSESYGKDHSEVESDVDFYWDDFLQDYELDGIDENTPEEEAIRIIKADYLDDFIEWRKEKMQEEEEGEDSWKYEPDTESSEFQQKAYDYKKEIAEQMAWEQGLVTAVVPDVGKVEIQLHKKHWDKFKPILKETIRINMETHNDDEEPYWRANTLISIDFIPEGGFKKSAYQLLQSVAI